jgi:WS/DGAT/MGAT family acyltransferase
VTKVRERLDATLEDVVLAVTAGAVRRFFFGRGIQVDALDFRALVPTNIRPDEARGTLASRIATILAPLPLDEQDPRRRLERVVETTRALEKSRQRQSGEMVAEIADWTYGGLMVQFARLGLHKRAANLVVTNVVGPTEPVYLLGARLREVYPLVPLGTNQTLSVALFSYAGNLHWGVKADWDVLPDLHDFVEAIEAEFAELCAAAADPRSGTSAVAEESAKENTAGVDSSWSSG